MSLGRGEGALTSPRAAAQALAVAPLFHAACAGWARLSGGRLPTSGDSEPITDGLRLPEPGGIATNALHDSEAPPARGGRSKTAGAWQPVAVPGARALGSGPEIPACAELEEPEARTAERVEARGDGPAGRGPGVAIDPRRRIEPASSLRVDQATSTRDVLDPGRRRSPPRTDSPRPVTPGISERHASAAQGNIDSDADNLSALLAWRRCLKRPREAMVKALLRYDGDVSRLLDVCRARIVFSTVKDLLACARQVCGRSAAGEGRAVRIRRVRSSLRPGYEVGLFDGLRVMLCPPPPLHPPTPAICPQLSPATG